MSQGVTTRKPTSVGDYFKNIWEALSTTVAGLKITGRYFFQKPVPERYRGIHYLEQDKCIECNACARACPIDCISMETVRHGKELEWIAFSIDYQKCMFCELCVYPCPADCIHMGTEFAFVTEDRSELNLDLLSYKGMSRDARIRMKEAEIKKAEKERLKKEKADAKAKATADSKGKEGGQGDA
ncbi:MAG: formate hydrogenlyase subunit 6/NADH:ubiquinone oxidoreductase subunit I [Candidatus Paceibacteria bacterium]|jgi:formate hydrogenlyase subunit 6/NADH:ubiquinone oxidoreductase subunit I